MQALAEHFTNAGTTDRIVLDRTNLAGHFAIDLRWSPNVPGGVAEPGAASSAALHQPSLFGAVREQLGLKLEPCTELLDVLVIDRVELPSPN